MPETDVDLRQWRLVLLSHEVFTGPSAAAVVDWAARQEVGLYQLPLPATPCARGPRPDDSPVPPSPISRSNRRNWRQSSPTWPATSPPATRCSA